MSHMKIILASSSPYRRELLARLDLSFSSDSPDVDETPHEGETAEQLVSRLAELKARAVAKDHPDSLIIASDQVATLNGKILGKPGIHENAVKQLSELSGQKVLFLTSLALLNSATNHLQCEVVPFTVHFRLLDKGQIERYLKLDKPYDCAGSFKSEALGVTLFQRLEGDDPNSLMGLPLIRLTAMLGNEGINLP